MKNEREKLLTILRESDVRNRSVEYESGEELLKDFSKGKYDLIFMDIYMSGITGIETVAKIREIDEEIPIAFTTTSEEYALESYRLKALKYIEKPVKSKDIEEMLKIALIKKTNVPSLIIKKNGESQKIPLSQIIYMEQQNHRLYIFMQNADNICLYEKLTDILPQLEGEGFFVPHKSYAVNLSFVQGIDKELKCFTMGNNKNVPIRRENMANAKKRI